MLIQSPCVVSLTWRLEDTQGHLIDELEDPVDFFYGNSSDLLPKVEEALNQQEAGLEIQLHLEPEHAFGEYQAHLVFFEERSIFPSDVDVGMQFEGPPGGSQTPDMPQDAIYTVTEVYPSHVVLDGNHPLAGIALRLFLVVRDVREASEEELTAGSLGEPVFAMWAGAPSGASLH
ncbi:MAG: peptidylprolyl isomerase [Burkholderiales bacterium]